MNLTDFGKEIFRIEVRENRIRNGVISQNMVSIEAGVVQAMQELWMTSCFYVEMI